MLSTGVPFHTRSQSGTLPPGAFLEVLGCLAQLDIPGYGYAQLLDSTGLHTFLAQLAAGGSAGTAEAGADPAALLLEVVQATGVLCANEACASMLAGAGLVGASCWQRRIFAVPFSKPQPMPAALLRCYDDSMG